MLLRHEESPGAGQSTMAQHNLVAVSPQGHNTSFFKSATVAQPGAWAFLDIVPTFLQVLWGCGSGAC